MYEKRIETCANRIRVALKSRRMKQVELCQLAKVPESSLSLYLKGEYEPKQDRIYNMARALNVSETWLMGYNVPMEREKTTPKERIVLTENQRKLLDLFDLVPEDKQPMILGMIEGAINNL